MLPSIHRNKEELRKDAIDALCCLAHALGEDFTIFIPSIHKLMVKHRLQVSVDFWRSPFHYYNIINVYTAEEFLLDTIIFHIQHKEFEEIQGRLEKREPLIFGSTTAQRLNRRLPVEVISDPLSDGESDLYEVGTDMQKQLRNHQVVLVFFCL